MNALRNCRALSLLLLVAGGVSPSRCGLVSASLGRVGQISAISNPAICLRAGARASVARALQARETRLPLYLPVKRDSVRFAVIGDSGTGQRAQYEVADEMTQYHAVFPF